MQGTIIINKVAEDFLESAIRDPKERIKNKLEKLYEHFENKKNKEGKDYVFLVRGRTDDNLHKKFIDPEIDLLVVDCVLLQDKNYEIGFGAMSESYLREYKKSLIIIVLEREDLSRLFKRNPKGYLSPTESVSVHEAYYIPYPR